MKRAILLAALILIGHVAQGIRAGESAYSGGMACDRIAAPPEVSQTVL